jgi:hypothetical protein
MEQLGLAKSPREGKTVSWVPIGITRLNDDHASVTCSHSLDPLINGTTLAITKAMLLRAHA